MVGGSPKRLVFPASLWRSPDLVKHAIAALCFGWRSAPFGQGENLSHQHGTATRKGQDVARSHGVAGMIGPLSVDSDMTLFDQGAGKGSGLDEAQPDQRNIEPH